MNEKGEVVTWDMESDLIYKVTNEGEDWVEIYKTRFDKCEFEEVEKKEYVVQILKLIKIVQRTMQNTSNYINIGNKVFDVEVSLLSLNWTKKEETTQESVF